MHITKNIILTGADLKPISTDIFYNDSPNKKPAIIYAHGFNGFKDWGNFDIIARRFADEGFVSVKFNFSHNGTTPATPEEFTDSESFGRNNYSKQLYDLNKVIDWVCDLHNIHHSVIDVNKLFLIGHSMGGGIATLHAATDNRIKKLITWAGISECKTPWGSWPEEKVKQWKNTGIQYYTNGRTGQQMPLYYQLFEDYEFNREKLSIEKAIKSLNIPILVCHGTQDTAVTLDKAEDLIRWQPAATLFTVESDHVFGRTHPWKSDELPPAMEAIVKESINFLSDDTGVINQR